TPFANEPFVDFSTAENKRAMEDALAKVESMLGQEYDNVVGGKRLRTASKIISVNPARPKQVIGIHQRAEADLAEQAVEAALAAFPA
ncbi:L-glutamate gamma-semialdehyde dehydrogenase, partial [Erwinia amylovora]